MNPFIILRESDDFSSDEFCTQWYDTLHVWIGNNPAGAFDLPRFWAIKAIQPTTPCKGEPKP